MNNLSIQKTMTAKEISHSLGVSLELITKKIKSLFPEIVKNGITTVLNENQIAILKNEIEKNPHLVQTYEVDLDAQMTIKLLESANYFKLKYEQTKEENNKLKDQNELVQKRVNLLIHNSKTYTSTEIAKELNLRSALELNKILSEKGVQFKVNKTWVLHAKYSDCDYESIKSEELDNGRVVYNRHWTGKGRDFIVNLLRGEL